MLWRDINNIPKDFLGCVATIGNYDGVHLGHQQLLKQLKQLANQHNLATVVITFEPLPEEYFLPEQKIPARLMTFREKYIELRKHNIDHVLCLRFNPQLAQLTADDFIKKILVEKLKIAALVVGEDFHFGKQRQGNITTLQQYEDNFHYKTYCIDNYCNNNLRISSTVIRKLLNEGHAQQANQLLGRHYSMSGKVIYGKAQGREWGFPTANIAVKRRKSPITGIYAVNVIGLGLNPLSAVAYIGNRPALDDSDHVILEVHIFNFEKNIYGKHITVLFLNHLRDDTNFESLDELKKQISFDIDQAKHFFSQYSEKTTYNDKK